LGWGKLIADLEVILVPAYFGTTMLEPVVRAVGEHLERAIDATLAAPVCSAS